MTLTELVPSLEVCQSLKAAGFPQDTALVWVVPIGIMDLPIPYVGLSTSYINQHFKRVAAPTAEEILKELPSCIERNGVSYYLEVQITPAWGWDVDWTDDDGTYLQPRGEEDCKQTIAEPAALAYLWWKEQK
jgi:hypothetical protein